MQAIKYKWNLVNGNFEPFLFLNDNEEMKRLKLLGESVSMDVGRKTCIGHFSKGRHVKCPGNRAIDRDWNCNECKLNDDFFMCMRCDGSECINTPRRGDCKEEMYFVYLAAFDSILKVGISRERRLIERLIEQGADFGAKIAVVKDGKDVRVVEQEINKYLNIVDRVSGAEKQKKIFGSPNAAVTNISRAIVKLQNNGIKKYMVPPEIYDLREYYHLKNVPYQPRIQWVKDSTKIEGQIVAAKGGILILNSENGFFSVNTHDLIGREITQNN